MRPQSTSGNAFNDRKRTHPARSISHRKRRASSRRPPPSPRSSARPQRPLRSVRSVSAASLAARSDCQPARSPCPSSTRTPASSCRGACRLLALLRSPRAADRRGPSRRNLTLPTCSFSAPPAAAAPAASPSAAAAKSGATTPAARSPSRTEATVSSPTDATARENGGVATAADPQLATDDEFLDDDGISYVRDSCGDVPKLSS